CRTTGVKLQTTRIDVPSSPRRKNDITLDAASDASTHSNPPAWQSPWCMAGSDVYSLFRSLTHRSIPACGGNGRWCQSSEWSCIHPMSHLSPNPRPPVLVGRLTCDQAVDSSAYVCTSGYSR